MLRRWLTWHGLRGHGDRQRDRHRRQDLDQVRRGRRPLVRARLPVRARAARRVRRARLPAADVRAPGHRARAGDARADRGADRARARVRGRRTAPATSTSTCGPGRRTGRCPGSGSRTWSRPATPIRAASATRATSPCGRVTSRPSRSPRPGRPRGVAADRAGTWSARRWPGSTSATSSTSTAAVWTCGSRTTRTSWRSRRRPVSASPGSGCTTPGSPRPGRR